MSSSDTHFGLTGLATMGANLARNVAHHDIPVAVHNRTTSRMQRFIDEHGSEGAISGHESVEDWVGSLARPRVLMSMVQAGPATDAVIDEILPHLDRGDIVIDGGNANFRDTQRRHAALAEQGIHFLGVGVSGGEEGALNGPSIMPGGDRGPYDESVKPILKAIAADVDGTPCCTYVGPDGAGHYVKMVHNGIEYADMQLIAESYDLLRNGAGLEVPEIADRFRLWNESELESFLIEISARVLAKTDDATGQPVVDVILDAAEQKGTGTWTVQTALDLGIPVSGIAEAVFARGLSSAASQRAAAVGKLPGPNGAWDVESAGIDSAGFVEDVRIALYASKIVAYAQGLDEIFAGAAEFGWDINVGAVARIWRGGCIIRAKFLNRITEAYDNTAVGATPASLLLAPYFTDAITRAQDSWRRVVAGAAQSGIPTPGFAAALSYYDGLRSVRLPAALIQGQRDFFGAHTYKRVDKDGVFHTLWSGDRTEVQTA